ncbi:MAG: helix-hairpin-helix domain-containing protein [Candidatus Eisenbacteria bacterium]|uniref:Helix-hairpin-helix domain-containing protein n=1 Tax=Eiseniibacteriota bacterium TaxID=2212470 RepID=A0A538TV87_UNCEI|nr:MAG: helix-hairpin-helix domain-containing protein [Candidatus Eisenbacteria bacterium]
MERLTAAERRGALALIVILTLGAARDLWRTARLALPARVPEPPTATAERAQAAPPPADDGRGVKPEKIDLNRASLAELDALPGIGPVLAARIVEHRLRHGPFRAVEELRAVRGIGPRLLARLAPRLTVGGGDQRPP